MKYLNFKTKIFITALLLLGAMGATYNANATVLNNIDFAGRTWTVKSGAGGPGPNNWGNTDQDVFVDGSGLHLKVSQHEDDQKWYSSEVYLPGSLGYGKYTFDINSHVDQLDQNLVAAPFLYQDDTHEIDIEHSLWSGETGAKNLFYTVQPYNKAGNQQSIASIFSDGVFQDIIDWQPDKINFSTKQNGNEISSFTYTTSTDGTTDNFNPGNELVHINFWQYKGATPGVTSSEFLVSNFAFDPYVAPNIDPTTSTTSTTTPDPTPTPTPTSTTSTPDITPTSTPDSAAIHLKIKTFDSSIYDQDIKVTSCAESPSSSNSTINAWCAVEQAATTANLSITNSWSDFGVFLIGINQYNGADGKWWLWYSDAGGLNPGLTALNSHILQEGETLILTYDISPLRIFLNSDNNPSFIYSTTTIYAQYFDDLEWTWKNTPDVNFEIQHLGQTTTVTSTNGEYSLYLDSINPYTVKTTKDGFLDSDTVGLEANLPKTSINLTVNTSQGGTIYQNSLDVSACPETDGSQTYTLNAMCALKKSGLTIDWSTWGTDMFLNSINSYSNDFVNGIYWNWFSGLNNNLDYGQTALNKHILTANENLVLTYDVLPLKISADTSTPSVGSTSTITLEEFSFDESFNPVWKKANSSTLLFNKEIELPNDSGTYYLPITSTDTIYIFGQKPGFVGMLLTLNPTTTNIGTTTENNNNNSGGGSGGSTNQTHKKIDVDKAVDFLLGSQNSNGSFGSSDLYTDWAAIALATQNDSNTAKAKVKEYLLTDPNFSGGLNPVSDLARRSMALMSLGINPYNGTKTNFIQKIVDSFDGTQFGDNTLYNDDIFALFPLLKAGYQSTDSMITKDVQFILSKQKTNGSWDGIDLTVATVQALSQLTSIDGVNTALNNAKQYLQTNQGTDGGFGSIESTAWAIQGIHSLNESPDDWLKNNLNPNDFLYNWQSKDGGMGSVEEGQANLDSRIWSTSYSIPAGLNKSWNEILNSFSKPVSTSTNPAQVGGVSNITTTTATNTTTSTTVSTSTNSSTGTTAESVATTPKVEQKNTDQEIKKENKTVVAAPKNIKKELNNFQPATKKEVGTKTQQELSSGQPEKKQNEALENLPLDTPTRRTAKKVLAVTGGSAAALGLYLGLRLVKNVL